MKKYVWFFLPVITASLLACGVTNLSRFNSPLPTPTPVAYPLSVRAVNDNLATLPGYHTRLTVDFAGQRNGNTVQGSIETLTEVTQKPAALHQTFRLDGQLPKIPAGVAEYYRLADRVYLKKAGDTLWSQFSATNVPLAADGTLAAATTPASVGLPDLTKLMALPLTVTTPPLTETLNGRPVTRYAFTEADLADPNLIFDRAEGEVWLATPGKYVVQYVLSTTQHITLPDPQTHLFDRGQLNLRYTLTELDKEFTIAPPADFPTTNTLANLPRLPDAEIVAAFPNLVEYVSPTTPISATQFYQNELAAQEWTAEQSAVFEEKARLVFSKENQTLTIIITPLDGGQNSKVLLDIR